MQDHQFCWDFRANVKQFRDNKDSQASIKKDLGCKNQSSSVYLDCMHSIVEWQKLFI